MDLRCRGEYIHSVSAFNINFLRLGLATVAAAAISPTVLLVARARARHKDDIHSLPQFCNASKLRARERAIKAKQKKKKKKDLVTLVDYYPRRIDNQAASGEMKNKNPLGGVPSQPREDNRRAHIRGGELCYIGYSCFYL